MGLKISREQEATNRLEKIRFIIEKGYTANIETGEVFGPKGKLITRKHTKGYIRIGFWYNGKMINIFAHQFIYYLATGIVDYGKGFSLDHNNRVKDDNRISNLSIESDSIQQRNRDKFFKKNARGYYWDKRVNKWRARIWVDGKQIYLGLFIQEEDARNAYLAAKEKYHIIK